ncbi:calcineurin-like phosphoesterase family protein [Pseudonocardia sediminis]|uniref:Calcineurin-like phosphoesterase family protein n=1 Tax=Pseudonocardia sediminis TaxID=1397368 RepID=A0A4Q7UZ63_PSEST|nr:metallophosphoesterase [Pseudonocardia sediminis]RZT87437.1 calcineurin-like phosphoesterase family protein [Pseudonocardia sediminis]
MKIAVVGDTHGNMTWLRNDVIPYARDSGCDLILQVGDFGFVWPQGAYENQVSKLNRLLDGAGLRLLFLPGNHEDHAKLARFTETAKVNDDGHYVLRSQIAYTGRVSSWVWEGRRLAAVGGAVSIDREWRVQQQRRSPRRTAIWWPEEVLSPEEVDEAKAFGTVDVLFTHDGPSDFPEGGLKPDLDSTANRQRMTDIGRALRPRIWFHGHYHQRVTYGFRHDYGTCAVHCLDCDYSPRSKGVEILDLSTARSQV